jgi:hypothetical protein
MLTRSLLSALLALCLVAPAADAATLGDGYVPDAEAMPGLSVHAGARGVRVLRFGPKAAKLYRTLAGRRATLACGSVVPDDGWLANDGSMSTTVRLPRRRGPVAFPDSGPDADVCAIATKHRAREVGPCSPPSGMKKRCIRVIASLTAIGRAYLDEKKRTIELFAVTLLLSLGNDEARKALAPLLYELPSPDASPPAGKVGYLRSEDGFAAAALLATGARAFMTHQDGVYSTNVPDLMGPGDDAFLLL